MKLKKNKKIEIRKFWTKQAEAEKEKMK